MDPPEEHGERPVEVRFGTDVEPHHERLDPAAWRRVFVIGDVHGCVDELRRLLGSIGFGDDDLAVFVGDLTRKGPDSAAVIDLVRAEPNLRSVRGNNEQKLIDGTETLGLAADQRAYLESMPLAISLGDALVVHGGVDPRKSLTEQTRTDLLESRSIAPEGGYVSPLWFETYRGPPRVFFGHTVLDDPYVSRWAVGLDTGCVHGRQLTAYELTADRVRSVSAATSYRSRSEDSIVSVGRVEPPA